MKNIKKNKKTKISLNILTGILAASLLSGCLSTGSSSDLGGSDMKEITPELPQSPEAAAEWIQVERLARPAINEGLILSNDYLNAFNSISPDLDLSTAAAPVRDEAVAVLSILKALALNLGITNSPTPGQVAAGFLPDVMRIDVTTNVTPSASAYNACADLIDGIAGQASLCGGRKLKDDVGDITLSYLIAGDASGAAVKDNVDYSGAKGWHHALLSDFPFVTTPVTTN